MASLPSIGSLYYPRWNNIAWNQPVPGGTVYPQQNDGPFGYPVAGINMQEQGSGLWTGGCGHWYDCATIWKDVNDFTNTNVAIIGCPLCSYVFKIIEPYSAIEDPIAYAIIIP